MIDWNSARCYESGLRDESQSLLHQVEAPIRSRAVVAGGRTGQRTVLYLGEIYDQQQAAWRKTLPVFDELSLLSRSRLGTGRKAVR
jgi:hypothetical protein